jgi:NhaP-type Na+/H+ or K+/H+ antiporter
MVFWPFSLGGPKTPGSHAVTPSARRRLPQTEQEVFDALAEQVMVWVLLFVMLSFLLHTSWNYFKTKRYLRQNYELKQGSEEEGENAQQNNTQTKEKGN